MNNQKNKSWDRKLPQRKENTRKERIVIDDEPRVVFNFRDFDKQQIPPGQSFNEWEKDGRLSPLFKSLVEISELTLKEAMSREVIKKYKEFPPHSFFEPPKHIAKDANWATINRIDGQKSRVVGHLVNNIFYVVFLDKNHQFYPTKKKNT